MGEPSLKSAPRDGGWFGAGSPLVSRVEGFTPRPGQREMAEACAGALATASILVAEAGTGTGKTLAYLVPVLESGLRVVISTGTRTLQDQLFEREIPRLSGVLPGLRRVARLKGRANYLCRHRLQLALAEGAGGMRGAALAAIGRWALQSHDGDIAGCHEVPEGDLAWRDATSTTDSCLGSDCPQFEGCAVFAARGRAQEADLVVVNHHVLCADLALAERGFGQLLPRDAAVVCDEAHQLVETLPLFFSTTLGASTLRELARDTRREALEAVGEAREIIARADALEHAVTVFRLALGEADRRLGWEDSARNPAAPSALEGLAESLAGLAGSLAAHETRSAGLAACHRRARELADRVAGFQQKGEGTVRWMETRGRGFTWYATPVATGALFATRRKLYAGAWIFTSATLSSGGRFDHFLGALGLEGARTASWPSPFDYPRQALLYLPPGLPDPRAGDAYTDAAVEAAIPAIEAARGRTFFLFTSHRALQRATARLRDRIAWPLLVQGSLPRAALLDRFRALGNAVLLGTASFREGVDVRGEALSLVIVDRLPFAAPDDPLLRARSEAITSAGGDAFRGLHLPAAVLALRQAAGRLIRDAQDRGVLMVCDPRLGSRGYGKVFLESLPPMRKTSQLADVQEFFSVSGERT